MNSSLSCPFHWWYWRVNVAGSKQPTALFIFTYSHFNMLLLVICESIWTSQAVCMSLTISGNLLIVIVKLAGGVQLCCLCFLFMYLFILWPRPPFFFEPLIFLIQHQNIYHNYKSFKSWLRMIFFFFITKFKLLLLSIEGANFKDEVLPAPALLYCWFDTFFVLHSVSTVSKFTRLFVQTVC